MSGPSLHVHGDAIRSDAAKIADCTFPLPPATVSQPCGLPPASAAAQAFNRAAGQSGLGGDQKELDDIKRQIVEALGRAATAYDLIDDTAAAGINGLGGVPAGTPQMGAAPSAIPTVGTIGDAAGGNFLNPVCFADDAYADIEAAQAAFAEPDDCASLLAAMSAWASNAEALDAAALSLPTAASLWEGTAAEQAYARVAELKQNLVTLANAWRTLAGRANGFAMAHQAYKTSHTEVYEAYKLNESLAKAHPGNAREYFKAMAQQVATSEEIRRQYGQASDLPKGPLPAARGRNLTPMAGAPGPGISPVSWPASSAGDGTSSVATGSGVGAPSSGNASQGGGGSPADGPPGMQDAMGAPTQPQGSPQDPPQGGEGKQAGQPPSGGTPSGGSPSGGSPAGGGMPGGMPGAGKSGSTPFSPSVHPASAGVAGKGLGGAGKGAGGAGKGAGGGGKGAGGGMGGRPLSPAAVAVGPPTGAGGAGAGPGTVDTGRAPTGVGAGGAGMPMMGHGAGHNQGKEKKRSAELSPDESLYAEDRPWTEGVVGHRRREIQGDSGASRRTGDTP